jgi:hypothetical protein
VPRGPTPTARAFVGAFAPGSLRSQQADPFFISLLVRSELSSTKEKGMGLRRAVYQQHPTQEGWRPVVDRHGFLG